MPRCAEKERNGKRGKHGQWISPRDSTSLGLSTLKERFERERIDHEMINTLSDGELTRLGVATIGDRHRLRRRCTEETEKQQVNII